MKDIIIFGCSHSRSFKDVDIEGYNVSVKTISGASILGLPKNHSHLSVAKEIKEKVSRSKNLGFVVIKLGQVDIENVYLYKRHLLKPKGFRFDNFLTKVIASYEIFLDSIRKDIDSTKIIVWGSQPPTPLDGKKVSRHYWNSMTSRLDDRAGYARIMRDSEYISDLKYDKRLARSIALNKKLKRLASKRRLKYQEVFDQLLGKDMKIDPYFEGNDYHIKGTGSSEVMHPADPKVKAIFEAALIEAIS